MESVWAFIQTSKILVGLVNDLWQSWQAYQAKRIDDRYNDVHVKRAWIMKKMSEAQNDEDYAIAIKMLGDYRVPGTPPER